MDRKQFSRRDFIRIGVAAGTGLGLTAGNVLAARGKTIKKNIQEGSMSYAVLGRTNMLVSRLALGGLPWESNVARTAIERGCNLVHGSMAYGKGQIIFEQGKALKGLWDKVFFMLKGNVDEQNIDAGLKALGTDHVDVILPVFSSSSNIADKGLLESFHRFKKAGKVSFLGFTVHSTKQPLEEIVSAGVKTGFFDVVLTMNQPARTKGLIPALKMARKAGVGTVSMKTLQGAKGSMEDMAGIIEAALTTGEMDVVLKAIGNFDQLNAFADKVAKVKSERASRPFSDEELLRMADHSICGACGSCARVCPSGLDLPEIMRCVTYYAPELADHARDTYRRIPRHLTALSCQNCGTCEKACPRGLPIRTLSRRAHRMWA